MIPEVLRCYRIRGANVTIPHKQAVMPLLSEVSPGAQSAGAVNTIVVKPSGESHRYKHRHCRNCRNGCGRDVNPSGARVLVAGRIPPAAYHRSPEDAHVNPSGARVLVAGAGGAARAAVACLTAAGAAVFITNRTMEKAEALAAESGAAAVPPHALNAGYDLVINATPAGMSGFSAEIPIPEPILTPQTAVFDMVYEPETTPLIAAARAAGCRCRAGRQNHAHRTGGGILHALDGHCCGHRGNDRRIRRRVMIGHGISYGALSVINAI
ncbi:MAG TPA: hypothetical protein O0X38_05535, partial [Methanocorpusculum sp.]|nr:hypothetical protein [Methanocorpusculum sp.]